MIYKINWMEVMKTSTGKVKAMATLIAEGSDVEVTNVTIWSDFPGFTDLRPGATVDGDLVTKNIKGKDWTSLYASKNANGTYKPTPKRYDPMAKAVQAKNESIARAQEHKDANIKNSSTFRDATALTVVWREERMAKGLNTTAEEWQTEWRNVRSWLDARYDEPF